MAKNKIFTYTFGSGYQGMVAAKDVDAARLEANLEHGRASEVRGVRLATQQDISWFEGMGGRVPKVA